MQQYIEIYGKKLCFFLSTVLLHFETQFRPCIIEVLGIKCPFFHLQGLLIFSEVMTNPIKNVISEKKVGVTHEKMGI